MWFWKKQSKIDEEIFKYHFSDDLASIEEEYKNSRIGLGFVNIPNEKWRKSKEVSNADFKNCINNFFSHEINKLGFTGKDYKYIKECAGYTAVINFVPWRYGGGIQVDLLVKINNIKYPPSYKSFKSGQNLKYCEFSKRLSPLNMKVWVWPFENSAKKNEKILGDILDLVKGKGMSYFSLFDNVDKILEGINLETLQTHNYFDFQNPITGFPSTNMDFYEGLLQANYFVFEFARIQGDFIKALQHARYGLTQIGAMNDSNNHIKYHEVYEKFIAEQELKDN
jgi:hypothetical protein